MNNDPELEELDARIESAQAMVSAAHKELVQARAIHSQRVIARVQYLRASAAKPAEITGVLK